MQSLTHDQTEAIRSALRSNDVDEIHKRVLSNMLNERSGKDLSAVLYVDGAADLHSKTAGIGGVVYINQDEVFSFSEPLFEKTNNEAEYLALLKGVQVTLELKISKIDIYSDSELIVKQINGDYKIKNDRMKVLHSRVISELKRLNHWTITHIMREKNIRADELSKMGMQQARHSK
ncbi:MAG TPA: ribonuclease HI family protein [Candidatus Marinimicrobia bacterium]|nr:ribonuclease HI family protein [Candidatus Neomarinimicrobiota bacterium]